MTGGSWGATAFVVVAILACATPALAQQADTTTPPTAQEGQYDRPFIASAGATSIGGYLEGNTNSFTEDGVSEGFGMELRRFNVFLFSTIGRRIRFLSELEFEHGTEEIALETAQIDLLLGPALNVRAGILLPPLGYFNQNHDSPKWDFVERPLVSDQILPATLSEVGAGVFGRWSSGRATLTYDLYLTNGLGEGVVANAEGRTHIPSGKTDDRFAEDDNGSPALSGRVAVRLPELELGLSVYGGAYNVSELEGEPVDEERGLSMVALDAGAQVGPVELRGEAAIASIDVPPSLTEIHGERQWGVHVDALVPVWRPVFFGTAGELRLGLRLEHVDFNRGSFSSTGESVGDEITAVVPTLAFRPTPSTIFRLNVRREWHYDLVGNDPAAVGGWQLGFAAYF